MNNISDKISIEEVLTKYGIETNDRRRIPCPIHGGDNSNFGYNDRTFHCFTCGAKGNAIGLVEQLFKISKPEAIRKINRDFNLVVPGAKCPSLKDRAAERNQKIAAIEMKNEREAQRKAYLGVTDIYRIMNKKLEEGLLLGEEAFNNELFVWWVHNRRIYEQWLDLFINKEITK